MSQLIKETEDYILQLLNYKLNISYVYHNLAHTQRVVSKVNKSQIQMNHQRRVGVYICKYVGHNGEVITLWAL